MGWPLCFAVLMLLSTSVVEVKRTYINLRPTIGILTEPTISSQCETFSSDLSASASTFSTVYTKWVEMAGARAIAIPYNAPKSELDALFDGINGVLFTGGGLTLGANTTYFKTAKYLYDRVLAANDAGDYMTLWGTCMGFQLLNILTAGDHNVLSSGFDAYAIGLPLHYTAAAPQSRLLGSLPEKVYQILGSQPVTTNLHHDGVTPETFNANTRLSSFYALLSTNEGRKGRAFTSTIEAQKYPIYGTQWHPERNQFEWVADDNITHTPEAMLAMQAVGNFLVSELRKSTHSFDANPSLEQKWIVYSWPVKPTGTSYECYFFAS